jgi:hypothetical protein
VTGDKDLLTLRCYEGTASSPSIQRQIVHPHG